MVLTLVFGSLAASLLITMPISRKLVLTSSSRPLNTLAPLGHPLEFRFILISIAACSKSVSSCYAVPIHSALTSMSFIIAFEIRLAAIASSTCSSIFLS
jgi:hypothetical protein